jgi:hypothetical protein
MLFLTKSFTKFFGSVKAKNPKYMKSALGVVKGVDIVYSALLSLIPTAKVFFDFLWRRNIREV